MTRLIDIDNLSKRDLKLIHDTLEMIVRLTEGGVQSDLFPVECAADDRDFDEHEKLEGGSLRWLTIPRAAPMMGLPEKYIYKNWAKLRIGRKVRGGVYIDMSKVGSIRRN